MTHHKPIQLLKMRIIVEAIEYRWYRRAPHQNDNAQVIKLISSSVNFGTMIACYMKPDFVSQLSALAGTRAYKAERKKHMATPEMKVEKTTISPVEAVL